MIWPEKWENTKPHEHKKAWQDKIQQVLLLGHAWSLFYENIRILYLQSFQVFKAGSTLKFTSVNQELQYCFFIVQPSKTEVTVLGKTEKCISMKYFLLSKIWKSTGF